MTRRHSIPRISHSSALAVLGVGLILTAGCFHSANTQSGPTHLSRQELGDAWPLTVDDGDIDCVTIEGAKGTALVFSSNGHDYCINSVALEHKLGPDIRDIVAPDSQHPGSTKSLDLFLTRVNDACGSGSAAPTPGGTPTASGWGNSATAAMQPAWATMLLQCLSLIGKSKAAVVAALGPPGTTFNYDETSRYTYRPSSGSGDGDHTSMIDLFFDPAKNLKLFVVDFGEDRVNLNPTAGQVWSALAGPASKPTSYQADATAMKHFWTVLDQKKQAGHYVPNPEDFSITLNGTIQGQPIQLNCAIVQPLLKGRVQFDTHSDSYTTGSMSPNPDLSWKDAHVIKILLGKEYRDGVDYLLKADGTPATTPATTRPATTSPQTSGSATAKASLTSPQSAPRASPVHATSKLSASPLPVTSWPGEHFPETRTRALTEADLQQWDFAKTRYALNEIYARHGFPFHSAPIRHQFETFSWYHPVTGRSQEQTEQLMSAVERANLKLLAHRRSH